MGHLLARVGLQVGGAEVAAVPRARRLILNARLALPGHNVLHLQAPHAPPACPGTSLQVTRSAQKLPAPWRWPHSVCCAPGARSVQALRFYGRLPALPSSLPALEKVDIEALPIIEATE